MEFIIKNYSIFVSVGLFLVAIGVFKQRVKQIEKDVLKEQSHGKAQAASCNKTDISVAALKERVTIVEQNYVTYSLLTDTMMKQSSRLRGLLKEGLQEMKSDFVLSNSEIKNDIANLNGKIENILTMLIQSKGE